MPDILTRLTRALDDFIQLSISNKPMETFSKWTDLVDDWQAAKDSGLTDEETDSHVHEIAGAMENLCERFLDVSLMDTRFDEYNNELDELAADAGLTARLSAHNINPDDQRPEPVRESKLPLEQTPSERAVLFERDTWEHDPPSDPSYDEAPGSSYISRFSRASSPAGASSRASSIFSSCSPASSQSSLPSRSPSPCFSRSASPARNDCSQSSDAAPAYNSGQLAALRMFGYGSKLTACQQHSEPSGFVHKRSIVTPNHTEPTSRRERSCEGWRSPFSSLSSWACDSESGDSPSPLGSLSHSVLLNAPQGPLSSSLTLSSEVDTPTDAVRVQEQDSSSKPHVVGVKRQRESDEDGCSRPSKLHRQDTPDRVQRALPFRRVSTTQRYTPSLPRPSTLLSSAVRWLVEHPGVLFPSVSTVRSVSSATSRSVSEVVFAFKDIRRQMKAGQLPRFFLRAEHMNRWCAGYWHMRRLKDEKGWSRLNRKEKAFCIAFEEHGRVGQPGQGEVVVDEPSRSYVITHLNRIRRDIESAYRCMMSPDANLSTMGHLIKDQIAASSAEANAQTKREDVDQSKTLKENSEGTIFHQEPDITRSFNDWAAQFLHSNRNRKHGREPTVDDEPPLKRARLCAADSPLVDESFQQPTVLPAQFLRNVAPEAITSWFNPNGDGHLLPGTAIDPILGVSEGILAPKKLDLSVGGYDWNLESWGLGGIPSVEDNTTLQGSTNDTADKPPHINSAALPASLQSIVDDNTDSLDTFFSFTPTFASPHEADTSLDLDYLFGNPNGHATDSDTLVDDFQFGVEATYTAFEGQDVNEDWFDFGTNNWSAPSEREHALVDNALLSNISLFGPDWDSGLL